ncbi:hypothetical protein [Mucilaginibacter aquariorum]|uniref:Restriction endonuclease type IV Mrr domain-containing protein n=1 Tax=Mucilaginibacter aquariorum TaxID=2967225 RepID=A0ABT1SZF5_9SPHI|nr:hypothetical protein [Mucilaginibacter aquariorum]MCQ6957722.1 hypothetical protein [Mucilaginibacter aquariorum]
MAGHINNKYFLSEFIETHRKNLISKINTLEITEESDTIKLTASFIEQFTIELLNLEEPVPSKPTETYIEKRSVFDDIYKQKVYEIKVEIPFTGNKQLFDCKPSTSTIVYFDNKFQINVNSVVFWIVLEELDANKFHAEVSKFKGKLSVNLNTINAEVTLYNNQLDSAVSSLINNRTRTVAQKFDFMEKIGLKVNPKSDEYLTPSPVTKKQIPTPVLETQRNLDKATVPILQDKVYQDIKEVLYNVGRAIERKPSLYLNKHEEDLRDIFLLFLETRYDSTTGVGEAFNKKGKTDILLKHAKDGSNLFVAECKFWKGQKMMFEAVDQLLGYLTHRDSKTAVMTFVNQKDFSSIIETFRTEIIKHPNFNRFLTDTYSSSISYQFSLPSDLKNTIQIEFMFFHFPKP